MAMKKTKALALVLTGILSVSLLGGCGSAASSSDTKEITSAEPAETAASSGAADETATAEATATTDAASDETTTADETATGDTTIEEQVLMDANDVKITATEYTTDGIMGDGVKLLIENNGSADIGVGCTELIVNNYMLTNLFSTEVAAGKKSYETMDLSSSALEAAGIDNIGQIEIYFYLFDPDSYETTYNADVATIKTNHFDDMDTTPNDDGQELYNENGIRIVGKYVDENSFWGNAVVLYLENKTEQNIEVQCDDMSVNGFMVTPYFSSTVYAGKMAVDDITLMDSELEENGIESVDEVELTFNIIDPDTYETIVTTDPITFKTK